MTITREHLELAALAAGHTIYGWYGSAGDDPEFADIGPEECLEWAPHTDIADAARLAIRMRIHVACHGWCAVASHGVIDLPTVRHDGTDAEAERAYCEAVTLCAAEIGRRMREGGR